MQGGVAAVTASEGRSRAFEKRQRGLGGPRTDICRNRPALTAPQTQWAASKAGTATTLEPRSKALAPDVVRG